MPPQGVVNSLLGKFCPATTCAMEQLVDPLRPQERLRMDDLEDRGLLLEARARERRDRTLRLEPLVDADLAHALLVGVVGGRRDLEPVAGLGDRDLVRVD